MSSSPSLGSVQQYARGPQMFALDEHLLEPIRVPLCPPLHWNRSLTWRTQRHVSCASAFRCTILYCRIFDAIPVWLARVIFAHRVHCSITVSPARLSPPSLDRSHFRALSLPITLLLYRSVSAGATLLPASSPKSCGPLSLSLSLSLDQSGGLWPVRHSASSDYLRVYHPQFLSVYRSPSHRVPGHCHWIFLIE